MISPSSLMKRLGVGGGLVPFFKCVCLYFVVGTGGGGPSAGAVAAKCAPVFCLLAFVLCNHGYSQGTRGRYARRIAAGLALSALGDALLVWPQHFVAGMAAFAAAHIAYMSAFGLDPLAPRLGLALFAFTGGFLAQLRPSGALRVLVPLYSALLAGAAWRGAARGGAAAWGAALFAISDAVLGYSLFAGVVPYKQVIVMTTYYLGQLGIAVSAFENTPHAHAAADSTPHAHAAADNTPCLADNMHGRYARRIAAGLALSALGDALLVWPQHFVAGMAAFAAAHIAYMSAFGLDPLAPRLGLALFAFTGGFLAQLRPSGALRVLVPLYSALLAGAAWRGAARGGAAAWGAALFAISDAVLGYSLFAGVVPYKQVIVMTTYYLGQLGIAVSAFENTPHAHAAADSTPHAHAAADNTPCLADNMQ